MTKGWKNEPGRHALSSYGIRTSSKKQSDKNLNKLIKKTDIPDLVQSIYLYGSRVKGTEREDSDYDFYIKIDDKKLRKRIDDYIQDAIEKEKKWGEWDELSSSRKERKKEEWSEIVKEDIEDEIYEKFDHLYDELGDVDITIGIEDVEDIIHIGGIDSSTRTRFEDHQYLKMWGDKNE